MAGLAGATPARRKYLMDAYRARQSAGSGPLAGATPERRQHLMDAWRARKTQATQQADDKLYDPLAPLAGDSLRDAVTAAVKLQLDPEYAAINKEQGNIEGQRDAQLKRNDDYYSQYQAETKSGAAQQSQALSGIEGADPNMLAAFANQSNVMNQTSASRANDAHSLLAAQFAQQLGDLQTRRGDVDAKSGPLAMQALMELRKSEFDNAAVRSQIQLKGEEQAQNAADDAADNREQHRGHTITQNHNSAMEQHNAAALAQRKAEFRQGIIDKHRTQHETNRHNSVNERLAQARIRISQGKTNGRQSAAGHEAFGDVANDAFEWIKTWVETQHYNRHQAGQALVDGTPKTKKNPGRKRYNKTLSSVALDAYFDKHISKRNQGLLVKLGYDPSVIAAVLGVGL